MASPAPSSLGSRRGAAPPPITVRRASSAGLGSPGARHMNASPGSRRGSASPIEKSPSSRRGSVVSPGGRRGSVAPGSMSPGGRRGSVVSPGLSPGTPLSGGRLREPTKGDILEAQRRNSVLRPMIRREGTIQSGDRKKHRVGSGEVQVLQLGQRYFLKLIGVQVENPSDVDLTIYLSSDKVKGHMDKIETKGVEVIVPSGEGGLWRGDITESGNLEIDMDPAMGDPVKWAGVAFVKRMVAKPTTVEPLIYCYANFRDHKQDFSAFQKEIDAKREKMAKAEKRVQESTWKPGRTLKQIKKLLRPKFKYFDHDGSGDIDIEEFKDILENLGLYVTEARAAKLFRTCDFDGGGAMDIEELPVAVYLNDLIPPRSYLTPLDAFELFDENGSGTLDELEFFEALQTMGMTDLTEMKSEKIFKKYDVDRTGTISYPEFREVWLSLADMPQELERRGKEALTGMTVLNKRKKNLAALRDAVLAEEESEAKAFHDARVKAIEDNREMRLKSEQKKRVVRIARQRDALIAKKAKSKADRETSERLKKERRERERQKAREVKLKERMEREIVLRKAKEKRDREAARLAQIQEEKEARAKRGDDRLRLARMGLREVPKAAYASRAAQDKLANLVSLDLSGNKLDRLPQRGFLFWCASLRKLDLSHNRLEDLPEEIESMESLQILNLGGNYLRTLPSQLGRLRSLVTLNVAQNDLLRLPSHIGRLSSLRSLELLRNKLQYLPAEIGGMVGLRSLDLSLNELMELPEELGALTSLTKLDVSWNALRKFPRAVGNLVSLEVLDLTANRLKRLPDSLDGLHSLETLNLGRNELSEIPPSVRGLTRLLELDVSHNRVARLPREIGQITSLQRLVMPHNRLRELPSTIGHLVSLVAVELRDNELTSLPSEIGAVAALQRLDVAHNLLSGALPAPLGALSNLVFADISYNQINSVPATIGALTALRSLNLSHNRLGDGTTANRSSRHAAFPSSVGCCRSLEELNLGVNRLAEVPHTIGELKKLKSLVLSSNSITLLPAELGTLSRLTTLCLEHNKLKALPPSLGRLIPSLEVFSVAHNPLSAMPAKWCDNWTLTDRHTTLWSGYTDGQAADWAIESAKVHAAAVEAFEAHAREYIYGVLPRNVSIDDDDGTLLAQEGQRPPLSPIGGRKIGVESAAQTSDVRGERNSKSELALAAADHRERARQTATLDDFVDAVREKLGPEQWNDRFVRFLYHFFFEARKLGVAPRYDSLYVGEEAKRDALIAERAKYREDMAARAKHDHEQEDIRTAEYYYAPRAKLIYVEEKLLSRKAKTEKERRSGETREVRAAMAACRVRQDTVEAATLAERAAKEKADRMEWVRHFREAREWALTHPETPREESFGLIRGTTGYV